MLVLIYFLIKNLNYLIQSFLKNFFNFNLLFNVFLLKDRPLLLKFIHINSFAKI